MTDETNVQVPDGYVLVPVDLLESAARWLPDQPEGAAKIEAQLWDLLAGVGIGAPGQADGGRRTG